MFRRGNTGPCRAKGTRPQKGAKSELAARSLNFLLHFVDSDSIFPRYSSQSNEPQAGEIVAARHFVPFFVQTKHTKIMFSSSNTTPTPSASNPDHALPQMKRCSVPGCPTQGVVDETGTCSAHGTKRKRCKMEGCPNGKSGGNDRLSKYYFSQCV